MSADQLTRFCQWLHDRGGWLHSSLELRAQDVAAGTGVVALADLPNDTTVARIPKTTILSWRNAGCAAAIETSGLRDGLATVLALMYEWHRGAESPWHPYLAILPKRESTPLFWSEDDLGVLTGTEVDRELRKIRAELKGDFNTVRTVMKKHPDLFSLELHTFEHFLNMSSLFSSRAFYVDRHHGRAMVPLADIFNHVVDETVHVTGRESRCSCCPRQARTAHWPGQTLADLADSDEEGDHSSGEDENESEDEDEDEDGTNPDTDTNCMEIDVVKDVCAGSELFNTYGRLGNAVLLLMYGFTLPDNPHNQVAIDEATVRAACIAATSKAQVQRRVRLWNRCADPLPLFVIQAGGSLPDFLLAYVYTLCSPLGDTWDDLDVVEAASADTIVSDPVVRHALGQCLRARLDRLAVPAALESALPSARRVVDGERAILQHHLAAMIVSPGELALEEEENVQLGKRPRCGV